MKMTKERAKSILEEVNKGEGITNGLAAFREAVDKALTREYPKEYPRAINGMVSECMAAVDYAFAEVCEDDK